MGDVPQGVLLDLKAKRVDESVLASQAPAGALGLPEHLDARRLHYGIPNEAFKREAAFDWIYVWQILPEYQESDIINGTTKLVKAITTQRRERDQSARCVLVSAGLGALDSLRTHGIQIGDVVEVARYSPQRVEISMHGGEPQHLLLMPVGSICGSEDIVERRKKGLRTVVKDNMHVLSTSETRVDPNDSGDAA